MRDRALFDLEIDSKLRGCDLMKMKIPGDGARGPDTRNGHPAKDWPTGPIRDHGRYPGQFACVARTARRNIDDYAFPSRVDRSGHLSTRQYARLVDEWVTAIGLRQGDYGTHSLRRTKAAIIYKVTGNLRAIQILLGHTKIENPVRYLGVGIEDALELAEKTEI